MPHPLVDQLHFARSEFQRCIAGVSEDDGCRRLEPMNCISWMVGHLANQERWLWVVLAQRTPLHPELYALVGTGRPASTPSLAEMQAIWRDVTAAADTFLLTLTADTLGTHFRDEDDQPLRESVGTLLWRNITHYWFHTGEAHAVRQQLGHTDLPQFVGAIPAYRPG